MPVPHAGASRAALAAAALLVAHVARAQVEGSPAEPPGSGVTPAARAAASLPLESWDDDWVYPEGRIKFAGMRHSLFAGGMFTRWTNATARERFGAGVIDPDVTLYRPGPRGRALDFDFNWTGMARSDRTARIIAPTLGLRSVFVGPEARKALVPFATLRAGPYFVKTSDLGSHTVPGANATLGVEVARQAAVALRYDWLRPVEGLDLSNWSVSVLFKVPLGTPARATAERNGSLPPPGELVDVGGYRLHLVCRGEGSPTVVLDAGMSDAWVTWTKVQPALARSMRVCSYDRAGIGYSDPGPRPRTSGQMVAELHTLLANAHVPRPYVLVGHSFGGYNVRLFASRHPELVAGLVLVDASHEDQWRRYPPEARQRAEELSGMLLALAEQAERGERKTPIVPNLPPAIASRPDWYRTRFEEFHGVEASAAELAAANRSLCVPLVVISAGRVRMPGLSRQAQVEMRRAWHELQAELAALSPEATRVIASKSGHYVQRDQPEIVIAAVESVVAAVRATAARSSPDPPASSAAASGSPAWPSGPPGCPARAEGPRRR